MKGWARGVREENREEIRISWGWGDMWEGGARSWGSKRGKKRTRRRRDMEKGRRRKRREEKRRERMRRGMARGAGRGGASTRQRKCSKLPLCLPTSWVRSQAFWSLGRERICRSWGTGIFWFVAWVCEFRRTMRSRLAAISKGDDFTVRCGRGWLYYWCCLFRPINWSVFLRKCMNAVAFSHVGI